MVHILCISFLYEFRNRLLTFLLFVHWQHLIARNMRELFSSNRGVKCLRKQFAQQVARHVDLRVSVSQLNPMDLLAEFERIDTGVRVEPLTDSYQGRNSGNSCPLARPDRCPSETSTCCLIPWTSWEEARWTLSSSVPLWALAAKKSKSGKGREGVWQQRWKTECS